MLYTILPDSAPILHRKMPVFDFANPIVDPAELAANLLETMEAAKGIGLAANQVDIETRVFVLLDPATNEKLVLFNPVHVPAIVAVPQVVMGEGCLSFPGISVDVRRDEQASFFFQDVTGTAQTRNFDGWPARIALHEYDHLEGVVFLDRISKLKRDMLRKKMAKLR